MTTEETHILFFEKLDDSLNKLERELKIDSFDSCFDDLRVTLGDERKTPNSFEWLDKLNLPYNEYPVREKVELYVADGMPDPEDCLGQYCREDRAKYDEFKAFCFFTLLLKKLFYPKMVLKARIYRNKVEHRGDAHYSSDIEWVIDDAHPSGEIKLWEKNYKSCTEYAFGESKSVPVKPVSNPDFEMDGDCLKQYKGKSKNVAIPEGVAKIGATAFWGCEKLTSVTIPGSVKTIGYSAFLGCEKLKSIVISEGVTTIEGSAFYGCKALKSVTLPESLKTIGANAFYACSGLQSITIPEGVTEIGSNAIKGCPLNV